MSPNLVDFFLLARLAEGNEDRTAIVTDNGSWTYGQVASLTSAYLERLPGVKPGERVIMAMSDGPDFVAALMAIIARGGVAVMINPEMTLDHLGTIVASAQAPCALIEERFCPQMEPALQGWANTQVIVVSQSQPPDRLRIPSTYPAAPDDPALWLFSGGTTGTPKIVVQRHRSFVNTTRRYAQETMGYRADDITISVPRLFFGYATGSALLFPFSVGATTVLFEGPPTPTTLLEQIRRHRPSILVTTPSAVNALLLDESVTRDDLASLRFATSAGEALPETLYHRWVARFGVELLDGLGTAEMWHIFISNRPGEVRPGTVGRAVPGFTVAARTEDGGDLSSGETGLLWVKGGSAALGYWEQPEASHRVFRGDWVVSGDLISIDSEGFITHRGRADDAVKVKGKWLQPVEVESCLLEHPDVAEAAVVVVEDQNGLGKPVAFVVTRTEVDEEALRQHVLSKLEPYKHPRRILFVDSFPRTHLGKIDRAALKRIGSE